MIASLNLNAFPFVTFNRSRWTPWLFSFIRGFYEGLTKIATVRKYGGLLKKLSSFEFNTFYTFLSFTDHNLRLWSNPCIPIEEPKTERRENRNVPLQNQREQIQGKTEHFLRHRETTDGRQMRRMARDQGGFGACWQHQEQLGRKPPTRSYFVSIYSIFIEKYPI